MSEIQTSMFAFNASGVRMTHMGRGCVETLLLVTTRKRAVSIPSRPKADISPGQGCCSKSMVSTSSSEASGFPNAWSKR